MTRRRGGSLAAHPVLIGAATVLIAVVGVYLSYNANNGLPFVPSSHLTLRVPDGGTVGRDSEVREGGFRIGVVEGLRPRRLPDGRVIAEIRLKLEGKYRSLPDDSTFAIRAKGAIGGKYIEVHRGTSASSFADDGVVSLGRTTLPTDLDEALSAFDAPTRRGVRGTLRGLGDGLAFRGPDLNETIATLPETLERTAAVMGNLAAPATGLRRFVDGAARLAGALSPVSTDLTSWISVMSDTLEPLGRSPRSLQDTVTRTPPVLADGTRALATMRPTLVRTAALLGDVEATAATARRALPPVAGALRTLRAPLGRVPRLGDDLTRALEAVDGLSADAATLPALRATEASVATLQPQLRFLAPMETVCNQITIWATMVPDILSEPDSTGTVLRGIAQTAPPEANDNVATMGANEFATGRGRLPGEPAQHLHGDVFAQAVEDDGTADCELGQQGFIHSLNKFDDTPDRFYQRAVIDADGIPQQGGGPLYKTFDRQGRGHGLGPLRVPPGQTFTRLPGGRAAPEAP